MWFMTDLGYVQLADSIINRNVDDCEHVSISKHVTEGLLKCHKNLVKIVAAASLDPKRARHIYKTKN